LSFKTVFNLLLKAKVEVIAEVHAPHQPSAEQNPDHGSEGITKNPEVGFLKGPKREIFVTEIFTEIRPVWVGDLETRPKNLKSLCLGPYITLYFLGFLF
jgi:hypothetical protein